jgi:uncharacterized protein (TIGR04255 family)
MKIPIKISPDRIKDAFVEVKYTSKVPFEVAVGMFYKSLDETYTYTNRSIGKQQLPSAFPLNLSERLEIQIGSRPLFYNDKIKIELQPNSIIFNCLNDYISWDIYKLEIEKVITQLEKADVFETYKRVGVRYISEYPNIDLTDCVKFSFTFGMPNIVSDTYSFHSEFKQDSFRIILKLNNKLPVLSPKSSSAQLDVTPISTIDIDVIMENLKIHSNKELLECIEKTHLKEKEVFFNLLNEKFLDSLNPIY